MAQLIIDAQPTATLTLLKIDQRFTCLYLEMYIGRLVHMIRSIFLNMLSGVTGYG